MLSAASGLALIDFVSTNELLEVCILCSFLAFSMGWVSAAPLPQPPFALNTTNILPAGEIVLKMVLQNKCFGLFLLLFALLSPEGRIKAVVG